MPTEANAHSLIERYKFDMLTTDEVKAHFGMNDLDSAGKRQLSNMLSSVRFNARPYTPLFETHQVLIESKQLSPQMIQNCVLVMLGLATNMQGSIRTDFKRMAKVLDEEGLEKHGEVLKKAWDIPDPKYINKQTMYNTKLVVVLVVA